MNDRQKALQTQYAHDVDNLYRAVKVLHNNKHLIPIETYQVCKIFIDRASIAIESTIDQMLQREDYRNE